MIHPIYRVRAFEIVAPYTLRVQFDDDTEQVIEPDHRINRCSSVRRDK